MHSVTLDSGRGKRRLQSVEGTRILEGLPQETRSWGLPQQVLATIGCVRRIKGFYKERTLKSSTKTQRDPGIQGE